MTRRFKLNWKVSVFALMCLVLFINLGLWQLAREKEKEALLVQQRLFESAAPLAVELLPEVVLNGQPVKAHGVFDTGRTLLLDNRVLDGMVGFEVLQLFEADAGVALLVNRGFVPMGRTRQDLPAIPPVPAVGHAITGRIYVPAGEPFMLEDVAGDVAWPRIVQQVDIDGLSREIDRSVYPYLVRLDPSATGALPRYWPNTVMLPAQHRGYAVQWFAMAVAVVIAWLAFSFRRSD